MKSIRPKRFISIWVSREGFLNCAFSVSTDLKWNRTYESLVFLHDFLLCILHTTCTAIKDDKSRSVRLCTWPWPWPWTGSKLLVTTSSNNITSWCENGYVIDNAIVYFHWTLWKDFFLQFLINVFIFLPSMMAHRHISHACLQIRICMHMWIQL